MLWRQTPAVQPCTSWLTSLRFEYQWGLSLSRVHCVEIVRSLAHGLVGAVRITHMYQEPSILYYSLWNGLVSPLHRWGSWRISICFIQCFSQTALLLLMNVAFTRSPLCLFAARLLYLKSPFPPSWRLKFCLFFSVSQATPIISCSSSSPLGLQKEILPLAFGCP